MRMFVGYRDLIIFRSPLIGGKEVHGANVKDNNICSQKSALSFG